MQIALALLKTIFKEYFGKDEFSGRIVGDTINRHRFFGKGPQGVIHTQGAHWASQRRFSLKTLKDFGFGKQSLESTVNLEIDEMMREFLSHQDCALSTLDLQY